MNRDANTNGYGARAGRGSIELIGEAQAEHMIEDWRSMVVVCDKGELRQGYTRGRRPR